VRFSWCQKLARAQQLVGHGKLISAGKLFTTGKLISAGKLISTGKFRLGIVGSVGHASHADGGGLVHSTEETVYMCSEH